ncbi:MULTISPECIES: DNA-methyltransferase [Burkholderia]|uniref:DNA-methyltransferase n=1 Tax=Burkholderia TaxID=32008 RepID=UPI0018D1F989|nr:MULTISPECIES: site-specific DNA-methyltransferase [Burkholderia]
MARQISDALRRLYDEFTRILRLPRNELATDDSFTLICEPVAGYLATLRQTTATSRTTNFLAQINNKFRINAENIAVFLERSAKSGYTFNYHEKLVIQQAFDRIEPNLLLTVLDERNVPRTIGEQLMRHVTCASHDETIEHVTGELNAPAKLRREVGDRKIKLEILKSLFASFIWACAEKKDLHRFFDKHFSHEHYEESYWNELQRRSPRLFHRDQALHFLALDQGWATNFNEEDTLRNSALSLVRKSYEAMNNHGFFIVLIDPIRFGSREISYELAADITLFGEKHLERPLHRAYFRHEKIASTTLKHIPHIDTEKANFSLVNEGFTYRDCILLNNGTKEPSQLLIFQKNHRDETLVPCPACRSENVEGNSYPSLGVKSWECRNPLCPDRSKYNRGKRYSFRALAMQQAIDDEKNDISGDLVKRWRRDVVDRWEPESLLTMIVSFYSMYGDTLNCYGDFDYQPQALLGRTLRWEPLPQEAKDDSLQWFRTAHFFHRFAIPSTVTASCSMTNLGDNRLAVYCGDSSLILQNIDDDCIDGAVTSPPYYNAREYSQWDNMYCYLQDMYNVNLQVFRILKPGSLYFYNIFDYFDNENIVALSALGQKRVTLSAYTVDLFRRIGFECVGNICWDKGEIEGKRGFNGGNFSPFYQSPFNCWEHVLVFRKPGMLSHEFSGSRIFQAKPVMKMIRGKNVHGHSAPFPDEIPQLCIDLLPEDSVVLDPFAGSLTTGRTAVRHGRRAICIEQSHDYCELGLAIYQEEQVQRQGEFAF